jgi:hypothetical protein
VVPVRPKEALTMAGSINSQLSPGARATGVTVATPPAPSTGTSTGTKVAVGTAAVAGGATLTLLLVSAATGWGVGRTLDKAWDKIMGHKPRR